MDLNTAIFYSLHARTMAERYAGANVDFGFTWRKAFPKSKSRILDIGCGSGRDLAQLLSLGYDAYGIEPVAELRAEATRRYPELEGRIVDAALPLSEKSLLTGRFDGILCSAVLMHIPEPELPRARDEIRGLLTDNGRLVVSLPTDNPPEHACEAGDIRLFVPAKVVMDYFCQPFFEVIEYAETADVFGRPIRWLTALMKCRSVPHERHEHGSSRL